MIDSLLYAKLPPHLKTSLNLTYLEKGTHDPIGSHLERELELSGVEKYGEQTTPTRKAVPPNDNQQNTAQTKMVCQYCKKPGHVVSECRKRMKEEQGQRNNPSIQNTKPLTFNYFITSQTEQSY